VLQYPSRENERKGEQTRGNKRAKWKERRRKVAKTHRLPYLYRSFSAKVTYFSGSFVERERERGKGNVKGKDSRGKKEREEEISKLWCKEKEDPKKEG